MLLPGSADPLGTQMVILNIRQSRGMHCWRMIYWSKISKLGRNKKPCTC